MIAALLGMFGGSKWWLIGVGVAAALAGWLYLGGLHARLDAAELRAAMAKANEQTAIKAAMTNAEAVKQALDEAERAAALLVEEQQAAAERAITISQLKERIRHAPQSTNCTPGNDDPVAPVLLDVLDGLRR